MICLNPVTIIDNSVKRGLFATDTNVLSKLQDKTFKEILLTDATTEEGEDAVVAHFKVTKEWEKLNRNYRQKQGKDLIGYKRYYKLLFLVKSSSMLDHVWFSFFEGMHCHAAIFAGLLCSKFDHTTNELKPGSLTLDDFKIDGAVENFKVLGTTVEEHLDQIIAKEFEAPMFHNEFHLSAYVTKQLMDAYKLIKATGLQSLWISNFKKSSATTTISKVLARWLNTTLQHSTKDTRSNSKYRPALGKEGHSMRYQEACSVANYKKKIHPFNGNDKGAYGYPDCLTPYRHAWDAYTKNPFDLLTRKDFLSTISLSCLDGTKNTKMMPPYAITFKNLTTDVGPITTYKGRKIDARYYNGYLIIPGIVYHMATKITNSLVTDCYGNPFKVGIINFIARFGNYMHKAPYLKTH